MMKEDRVKAFVGSEWTFILATTCLEELGLSILANENGISR